MHFPLMNRSALLRRPPVLQAAAAVLLTSAFMLPVARAQAAETADKASTGQASASPAPLTKGEIKAQREFKMLDFNKDGKLSRTEVALFPRLAAAFDEADTDKDGYVSYAEVQAFAVKYRAERDKAKAKAQAEEAKAAEHAAAVSAARDTKEGEGSKD
ncbi:MULTISPECIES: EF-hand domain-containing protein [Delftia]|uniref:EF-hand domain-containing protein n=1 Tax=Delftia TaxID=80865 RepID=UPI000F8276B7|nr:MULTISPECIES: EF-hand domain-containing protein [Delftia]MDH0775303.1 EF-hand domain-containing protein [Delftia tsuruhatensis]MDH1459180.1 EF-hand domain-containing protein [Delftia tsuruhatensis]MDH1822725.1 EF-hand domain-containing protein [Delftia tsuruhatensis]WEL97726.1 EF-hand domain-containing protein [Delftia tsuruhatensis]WGG11939.1 EF-hand domain-containing protein [Delftia tsuruhatensis]